MKKTVQELKFIPSDEKHFGSETISPLSLPLEARPLCVTLQQPPQNMPGFHWHGHIEINIPFDDDVEYLFNDHAVLINAGHIALFWASIPHRLINRRDCKTMAVLDIPVHQFLSWPLEQNLINYITHGVVIQSVQKGLVSLFEIQRWITELQLSDIQRHLLTHNEIQIMVKRIGLDGWQQLLPYNEHSSNQVGTSKYSQNYVQAMLDYIANHYNENITVQSVANAIGLHPNYTMGLFQNIMQLTIKQYITLMRINHAKALLSDTDKTMLDISLTAGFNSLSRFYDNFQKYTGLSPQSYRKAIRSNDKWSSQNLVPTLQPVKGASNGKTLIIQNNKA